MVIFITTCVSTEAHVSTALTAPQPNNRPLTTNHRPTDRSTTDLPTSVPPSTDYQLTGKSSTDQSITDSSTTESKKLHGFRFYLFAHNKKCMFKSSKYLRIVNKFFLADFLIRTPFKVQTTKSIEQPMFVTVPGWNKHY